MIPLVAEDACYVRGECPLVVDGVTCAHVDDNAFGLVADEGMARGIGADGTAAGASNYSASPQKRGTDRLCKRVSLPTALCVSVILGLVAVGGLARGCPPRVVAAD